MTIRRKNPKKQGLIGLGDAVAWFTANGYEVSLPLNDSQKYDLVVEDPDDGRLVKVQVKTTTALSEYGSYLVDMATNGGNRSRNTVEPFDPGHYDLLYVLTDAGTRYLIPSRHIEARFTIALGRKWNGYRVGVSPNLDLMAEP